ATPAARMTAFTMASGWSLGLGLSLAGRVLLEGDLVLLGLHALHEVGVGRRLDDLVELRAIVGDEAHALDADVVDEPALAPPEETVLDGDLGAVLGDDLRRHRRRVAVHPLASVDDLLAAVHLDLRDVRALEQIAEEEDELLPL